MAYRTIHSFKSIETTKIARGNSYISMLNLVILTSVGRNMQLESSRVVLKVWKEGCSARIIYGKHLSL